MACAHFSHGDTNTKSGRNQQGIEASKDYSLSGLPKASLLGRDLTAEVTQISFDTGAFKCVILHKMLSDAVLFVPQRYNRIDSCRAQGRNVAGDERHQQQ